MNHNQFCPQNVYQVTPQNILEVVVNTWLVTIDVSGIIEKFYATLAIISRTKEFNKAFKYSRTPLQRTPMGPGLTVRPKIFGAGQNRSFKRGVRLTRVFARRGSTVFIKTLSFSLLGRKNSLLYYVGSSTISHLFRKRLIRIQSRCCMHTSQEEHIDSIALNIVHFIIALNRFL